jgi:myosin heavy subunit
LNLKFFKNINKK